MKWAVVMMTSATILAGTVAAQQSSQSQKNRPNIVIIITDDQGYADISFNPHHPPEVSTPHMDTLAREGVFFNQAYISGCVCSPTRAGLMLGRYQQRVGVYTAGEGGRGFDPKIPIFPSFLPKEYKSTAIGKWHLGLDEDYPELKWHALSRGFDECYKFMGRGAHDYYNLKGASGIDDTGPMYRNKKRIDDEGYLTTRFTEEACDFIGRSRKQPFFLYLAYNAVHFPKQAPRADIDRFKKKFPNLTEDRAILMAMLYHLDLGVGSVVKKLKDEGVWDNTLLLFFTDNGGAKVMEANNAPLRGFKHSFYEGGIRTPFIVTWPAQIKPNRKIDTPIISLDILPTVLDALDVTPPPTAARFDGRSLLPLLRGDSSAPVHKNLFFSSGGAEGKWAVRSGDWKLVADRDKRELYNLAADPAEQNNLATPELVAKFEKLYDAWLDQMADPLSGSPKKWKPGVLSSSEKKRLRDQQRKAKAKSRNQK